MKLVINKKKIVYQMIVIFFIFYAYNTTFQDYLYHSRANGVILIIITVLLGFFYKFIKISTIKFKFSIEHYWILLLMFSIFRNQDMSNSTESRWILPMMGILLIYILNNEICWQNIFVKFCRFMVIVHAFFTIFFSIFKTLYTNYFINIIPGSHTYLLTKFYNGGYPGITAHYSTNGMYLGSGLIFFLADVLINKPKSNKDLFIILFKIIFVLYALLLTSKRAHILFSIISILIVYYTYNSNKKTSRLIHILGILLLGTLSVVLLYQICPPVFRIVNRFLTPDDSGEITNGRKYFWEFALKKFNKNPVFGIGWGGFKHEFYKVIGTYSSTSKLVDCHNVFLQLLCEQGITGLMLFIIPCFGTWGYTYKYLKLSQVGKININEENKYLLGISLGIQSFFILYCMSGNCLYDCEIFYIYIISCAITYSLKNNYIKNNNSI